MTKKCICEICSCGRHRCPHSSSNPNRVINKRHEDNCTVTEYRGNYLTTSPRRGPFNKPRDLIHYDGPLAQNTSHKADFKTYEVIPPVKKQPERYVPNPNKFETVSEHHEHYKGTRAVPAKMEPYLKGVTMRMPSARVEYKSTSHGDYKTYRPEPVMRMGRSNTYLPPEEPFKETSIHRQDYMRFNQPPRPTGRQPDKIQIEGSQERETTHLSHYQPKAIPPKLETKKEEYNPPEKPFNSTSVFKEDFQDFRGAPKAQKFRPISDLFATDKRMDSSTTKDSDYKAWEVKIPKQKTPEMYKRPEGDVDCRTTHMDYGNFGRKALPAKNARPKTKLRFGREDALDDTTNYGLSFRWTAQPQVFSKGPLVKNEVFPREKGFQETSEFLDKYKRFNVVPSKMFRDNSQLFKTSDRLSDHTVYKGDFDWPSIDCPSNKLLAGSGNFKFDHENEAGHRVFEIPAIDTNGSTNMIASKDTSLLVG
ncbi:stabilizer of axonemal microtubules 2 [Exaiptasia diaphana]|uniref:Stabilizer of axonemal microtubules 2 n=1 Tax=Exaiptasia diaphana TaxID=2652724 RepID=A0A913Y914_EXADI|nr:stabilizer of axonemal microtubules 2 [Exaiptasia diaphana]KXJ28756.1 Protein FAM154A [Exaiptasia diaphana]